MITHGQAEVLNYRLSVLLRTKTDCVSKKNPEKMKQLRIFCTEI